MPVKFVDKTLHAYLDYPVAVALIGLPFVLNLGQSHPAALWISVAAGLAAFLLTLLTDHHLGAVRVIPYNVHLAVDLLVGISFLLVPFVLGFTGLDAAYYWLNGAAVCAVIAAHRSQSALLPAR